MNTKTCNKCNENKPTAEFFRDKSCSDGFYSICKKCKTASTMQWRGKNREQYNSYMRKQHADNYERNRLYRYDLSPEQYQSMIAEQGNKCAICHRPPNGPKPLVIDHCHSTGKVRGLLCYGCNRLMVLLDNKELLTKAQAYKNKS
jgi:hypothetical protein